MAFPRLKDRVLDPGLSDLHPGSGTGQWESAVPHRLLLLAPREKIMSVHPLCDCVQGAISPFPRCLGIWIWPLASISAPVGLMPIGDCSPTLDIAAKWCCLCQASCRLRVTARYRQPFGGEGVDPEANSETKELTTAHINGFRTAEEKIRLVLQPSRCKCVSWARWCRYLLRVTDVDEVALCPEGYKHADGLPARGVHLLFAVLGEWHRLATPPARRPITP